MRHLKEAAILACFTLLRLSRDTLPQSIVVGHVSAAPAPHAIQRVHIFSNRVGGHMRQVASTVLLTTEVLEYELVRGNHRLPRLILNP
jgi:hypothetical protein